MALRDWLIPRRTSKPADLDRDPPDPGIADRQLRDEIRRSFDRAAADEEHFPSTIDPRIEHVQKILKFFGDLNDKKVLDAGCGKGRFARVLLERNPGARIAGLDLSEEMIRLIPAGIDKVAGSMNELPFADSAFNAIYATESLEHAVDVEKAVSELCRVLTPGGSLAIIDKNADHWGRLETPRWERWFGRREIEKLLFQYCHSVHSEFLSYWSDVRPDGLFIIWYARK